LGELSLQGHFGLIKAFGVFRHNGMVLAWGAVYGSCGLSSTLAAVPLVRCTITMHVYWSNIVILQLKGFHAWVLSVRRYPGHMHGFRKGENTTM